MNPKRILATTYPDASWRDKVVCCAIRRPATSRPLLEGRMAVAVGDRGDAEEGQPRVAVDPPVTAIPERFIGHGYCNDGEKNWFRSVSLRSETSQGNPFGTFHATREGHNQMGFAVVSVLCQQLYPGQTKTGNCTGTAREPGAG